MPRYRVQLEAIGLGRVEVEAKSEEQAIEIAQAEEAPLEGHYVIFDGHAVSATLLEGDE